MENKLKLAGMILSGILANNDRTQNRGFTVVPPMKDSCKAALDYTDELTDQYYTRRQHLKEFKKGDR